MKLTTTAPATTDFAALAELDFIHTADFQTIELEAKKGAFARLYERYKLLMEMEENGITVTVTLTSPAGTLTIKNDSLYEPMDYLGQVGNKLRALAANILDLTCKQQQGTLTGDTDEDRQNNLRLREALSYCLPANYAPAAPATPAPAVAKAA